MSTTYQFCPKCGSKYPPQTSVNLKCDACGYVFYQNSKPTSTVLILNQKGEVLLGRRAIEPSKGKWDVIGGFLELGEHPEAGAIREAKEETGLDIKVEKFLGTLMDVYPAGNYNTLNIYYSARVIGGIEKPGDDISELKWFAPYDIPEDIAYENGKQMLKTWKESLTN